MGRIGMVLIGVVAAAATSCSAAPSVPTALVASHASHDANRGAGTDCGTQYVEMMIPHHRQAVEMGRLADSRAKDQRVRRLAEAIQVSQGREMSMMTNWLRNAGAGVGGHAATARPGMPGVLTTAEMQGLQSAKGAGFDAAYLRGMIRHHWGAVLMSEHALRSGVKQPVGALAVDTAIMQRAEIVEMERLVRSLETGVEVTPERFARHLAKTPLVNPFEGSLLPDCAA